LDGFGCECSGWDSPVGAGVSAVVEEFVTAGEKQLFTGVPVVLTLVNALVIDKRGIKALEVEHLQYLIFVSLAINLE